MFFFWLHRLNQINAVTIACAIELPKCKKMATDLFDQLRKDPTPNPWANICFSWLSGLRRWFVNATHRGTGSRIPPLPRAEFGRLTLEWHNWLVTPREGGGLSRGWLRSPHSQHLGRLESQQTGEFMRLEEGVCFSGSLDPNWILTGAARDRVYVVNLKLIIWELWVWLATKLGEIN